MSQSTKEVQPPSYEEAMYASTEPSQFDYKIPNANINVTQMNAPYVPQYPNIPTAPAFGTHQQTPSYGAFETTPVSVVIQPTTVPPEIIVIGGCPACRIGILEDSYPCIALFCAILFFPVGILCCLAMKNKQCSNCGTEF